MTHIEDIRKALKSNKMLVGTKKVIKNLKLGNVKKVYLTSNAPLTVKETVKKYGDLGKVEVVKLRYANDELGTICKKPYNISVLGLSK